MSGRTKVVLLGTAGGPTPKVDRAAPAQAVVVDGCVYVVDCGNGVARQLARAGLSLAAIEHVLVTHQHSDHNADYGSLLLLAWAAELTTRVDTWGPPPLREITRLFLQMSAYDIATRIADEGRLALEPLIVPHEVTEPGGLFEDGRVRVTAAVVEHPPVVPALAYRFDTPDRSVVISGDTRPCDALVNLARGADVLVHEVMYEPAIAEIVGAEPDAATLREHLLASHTTTEQVGQVATAAGVGTLVLSHFVPAGLPGPVVSDAQWRAAVAPHFDGELIVGRDLLVV